MSRPPSRMSRDGIRGRKSLPTKKHMKTKSSISDSRLKGNGRAPGCPSRANSRSKYWRNRSMRSRSYPLVSGSFFFAALPRRLLFTGTCSRRIMTLGSCNASPSIIRSASCPQMAWETSGEYSLEARQRRMYSIILCSPSPGTDASEIITDRPFHVGPPLLIFSAQYTRRKVASLSMNSVPGVITLWSHGSAKGEEERAGGGRGWNKGRMVRGRTATISVPPV
mmetsp:Transcript_79328/g.226606  ORF Transcript_79328/g.226606 Transcript_79328/m.226606 type:complete len:223 (-) Transcript_79328:78-746(-)